MVDSATEHSTHRRVPAVTRAIGILRRLGSTSEPVGVNQLARDLDLIPSTCLHILRVLVEESLVEFDPVSKRYSIGVGILPIARSAIQRNGFAALAQPRLEELSRTFEVTALATQLVELHHMVVVALSHARMPFRLSSDLGSRFPALISATGRCVAAFSGLDKPILRRRFEQLKWDNPPEFKTWLQQIEQTRKDGYGVDRGNYISGVTIVAVPILSADGSVAQSLVSVGIAEKVETVGVPGIAQEMLRIRDEIAGFLMGD